MSLKALISKSAARRDRRRAAPTGALCLVVVALVIGSAGCGRSAPEGASPAVESGTEPVVAGIQVVSEQPVVIPPPSTATVITTVTTAAVAGGSYVVEAGDTLSVIAERFGVSVEALSQANSITDVNTIRPGQELLIPG